MTRTASEDFKKNLEGGFRYVDKTELLIPLLNREHETTFFLRPRRFGKTLTLSMIRYFVEDTRDENLNAEKRELFRGLKIMEAGESYIQQMTSFPVICLTLQTVKGEDFSVACQMLRKLVYKCFQEKSTCRTALLWTVQTVSFLSESISVKMKPARKCRRLI